MQRHFGYKGEEMLLRNGDSEIYFVFLFNFFVYIRYVIREADLGKANNALTWRVSLGVLKTILET